MSSAKEFLEHNSSSSKRGKLHCYPHRTLIYSENEYRDQSYSKAHHL